MNWVHLALPRSCENCDEASDSKKFGMFLLVDKILASPKKFLYKERDLWSVTFSLQGRLNTVLPKDMYFYNKSISIIVQFVNHAKQ